MKSTRVSLWIITLLSRATSAQSIGFDTREATVESVHHSLFNGLSTCRDVVSAFLTRIEEQNAKINAIISLNPTALETADRLDESLAAGNATGPLFCVPILLKDNYDTSDMDTTGGCLALKNLRPKYDAPSVKVLRNAGAIIIGKANLHELALEGISVSSLGGQTINPYDHTRTPGGSSGGTGAAIAASFAVFGTGTDTVNSLRSPASANSLFSIRPTRGLISRAGVIPISYTQDALGVIARTIKDVAVGLTVMAGVGYDAADNTTALIPTNSVGIDYAGSLDKSASLKGTRIGVLQTFFNRTASNETTPVNEAMDSTAKRLKLAGAVLVNITESIYNAADILAKLDTQRFEYREFMDQYLQNPDLTGAYPKSLAELYQPTNSSNQNGTGKFLVIPSEYEYVTTSLISSTSNASYVTVQQGVRNLTLALQSTFAQNNLDAIIYPEQKNLVVKIGSASQSGRNGILAALTGSPVVTVPIGFSSPSEEAPLGVPIGMEILGRPWSEESLLKIGYEIEQLGRVRKTPQWAQAYVEPKAYNNVPSVVPDVKNIPAAYPLGTL